MISSIFCCALLSLLSFPTRRSSDLVLLERGLQGRKLIDGRSRPRIFVGIGEDRIALPLRDGDGNDLFLEQSGSGRDRKSTRLNSSHLGTSYAVFCLKKKRTPTRDSA